MKYTKINFNILDNHIHLNPFMGSALRGSFGYALKKVVCINPSFTCKECFASTDCLYYDFYEKIDTYHKYRFDILLDKTVFDFNLYLFDDACEKLPYVLSALHKMLNVIGFGRDRVTSDNFVISVNKQVVYEGKKFDIPKNYTNEFKLDNYSSDILLKFLTPFRTKKDNRLLKNSPTLELILSSIQNRKNRLQGKNMEKLKFIPTYKEFRNETYFKELTRLSNRQKTKMQLGGIMGEIRYKNLNQKSYELLKLGEIIGIGKQCVFGLGKIKVEDCK